MALFGTGLQRNDVLIVLFRGKNLHTKSPVRWQRVAKRYITIELERQESFMLRPRENKTE